MSCPVHGHGHVPVPGPFAIVLKQDPSAELELVNIIIDNSLLILRNSKNNNNKIK